MKNSFIITFLVFCQVTILSINIESPNGFSVYSRSSVMLDVKKSDNAKTKIANSERTQIFYKEYGYAPDTSFQLQNGSLVFLVKKISKTKNFLELIVFNNIDNNWKRVKDTVISKNPQIYFESFEVVKLKNDEYLYFKEFQPGGSLGNISIVFSILNLNTYEFYYNLYNEAPGIVTTIEFEKSNNLETKRTIDDYLAKRISNSSDIHKLTLQEKLNQRFINQNYTQLKQISDRISESIIFSKTETDDKVFDLSGASESPYVTSYIENRKYIVVSFFKNSVLGYDKLTGKYFCVWTPNSIYDWVNTLSFISDDEILLYDKANQKPFLSINFDKSLYTILDAN